MAKRLTEEMVIARSKISDLSKVKRLNCWGSELEDVSLLQQMNNVEVLSLSINKINTLADFQYCNALQELYIRQNAIRDLNQICYLQNLRNLKNLWLGENPCANIEGYRLSVLKTLPQLQKLDNIAVTPEELKEAVKKGKSLTHPDDVQDTEEEEYMPQQYQRYQEYPNEVYSSHSSPSQQEPEYAYDADEDYYNKEGINDDHRNYSPPPPPPVQRSPPRRDELIRQQNYSPEQEYVDRRTNNYEHDCPRNANYYDKSPGSNNDDSSEGICKDYKIATSQSNHSIKEYANGERYSYSQQYRHSDGSETSNQVHELAPRRERYVCSASHHPPFNRRPAARNSNILSAVLCLVKELDYPSLEVVEMTIRCRMNELEE